MISIIDNLIKFSEDVGIGIFSYCAKLYSIPCMIAMATMVVVVFAHSTLVSKLFFLAVQGLGALLSSNLEGALYKSP